MIAQDKDHDEVLLFVNLSNVAKKLPPDVNTAGCAQAHLLILVPLQLCKLLQLSPSYKFKLADPEDPTDEELDRGQLTTLKTFLTHNVSADIWVRENAGPGLPGLRPLGDMEQIQATATYVALLADTNLLQPTAVLSDLAVTFTDPVSRKKHTDLVVSWLSLSFLVSKQTGKLTLTIKIRLA